MQTLDQLKAKHAKELREFAVKDGIREVLPDVGFDWKIYISKLYGTSAHVAIEHDFYAYPRDKPQPTLETVRTIAEQLPPEPLSWLRDSCLSFPLTSYVESLPDVVCDRAAIWSITPFTVTVDAFQQQTVSFKWTTKILGQFVDVKCVLPLSDKIGRYRIERKGRHEQGDIKRCTFDVNHNFMGRIETVDDILAELQPPIKWSTGSADVPNRFTLYWVDYGPDVQATVVHLVDALLKG